MTESEAAREHRLADAFVAVADTLVTGFDVADLFSDLATACVELLGVTAAGLMLVDAGGQFRMMASSSERSRLIELMEVQRDEGPGLDCFRTGVLVPVADLTDRRARWPLFTEKALESGFGAAYALPMRLRQQTVGALNLFHRESNVVTGATLGLAQALANASTIAILQQRALAEHAEITAQLQQALNSRVIIDQATGLLAGRSQMEMSAAFVLMRRYSRGTGQRLADVARAVIADELDMDGLRAYHSTVVPPVAD